MVLCGFAAVGSATPESQQTKHVMLPAFLSKTYEIFSMTEFSSVCGWNASGDTIIVSQLESFVSMVLPRFFKHRNFPSFVRQLNLYGFHKTVLDSKRLEFQHPYFKRDRPDLLHYIKRKVSTGPAPNQQQTVSRAIQVDASATMCPTLGFYR
jgi:heat shock transcription factor 1